MVEVAGRHPKLNLLNLEAVAAVRALDATIWLSPRASEGVLSTVLDDERLARDVVTVSRRVARFSFLIFLDVGSSGTDDRRRLATGT